MAAQDLFQGQSEQLADFPIGIGIAAVLVLGVNKRLDIVEDGVQIPDLLDQLAQELAAHFSQDVLFHSICIPSAAAESPPGPIIGQLG